MIGAPGWVASLSAGSIWVTYHILYSVLRIIRSTEYEVLGVRIDYDTTGFQLRLWVHWYAGSASVRDMRERSSFGVCSDLSPSHIGERSGTDGLLLVYCRHSQPFTAASPSPLRGYPANRRAPQQQLLSSPEARMMSSVCCWCAAIRCRTHTDETHTSRCPSQSHHQHGRERQSGGCIHGHGTAVKG